MYAYRRYSMHHHHHHPMTSGRRRGATKFMCVILYAYKLALSCQKMLAAHFVKFSLQTSIQAPCMKAHVCTH